MNPRTVERLLDPGEAAQLLAALPACAATTDLTLESMWAKPGRHFNVCYRLGGTTAPRFASLCIVDSAHASRAKRRLEKDLARDALAPRPAAMAAEDVLAQLFPFDYRLVSLAECMDPQTARGILGNSGIDSCEMVAYRPGMRCQLRYSEGGRARAYGKLSFERDPGRRRRVHRDLSAATAATAMRVPALLGSDDARGLDLVAAVDGETLYDRLRASPDSGSVARTAAALCQLHTEVPAPPDRVHACADELALARSWVDWTSELEPALAGRLGRILASLTAAMPATEPSTFAHRDFYDRQILFGDDNLWLLDVDTACTGDRELDLGNFLSQIFLRGVQWDRITPHRGLEAAARDSYGRAARRDVVRWYRSTSLLRLACVYRLRPRWRHIVPTLLEEAVLP